MNKVAIFGKPGSGKSKLSKELAALTGIPLHALDSVVYQANGELVPREIYDQAHAKLLAGERWIIDGFGPVGSFYQRLEAADTLIYVDLPYAWSYWWSTKRLLKSAWEKPEGWPEGSSVIQGTLNSYKVLKLCPQFWNAAFSERLDSLSATRDVYVIKSVKQLNGFARAHA